MLPFDSGTWIVLGLGLGVLAVFAWLFAGWRELNGTAEHLPLWSFLERQGKRRAGPGAPLDERGLRLAGVRCATCDSQRTCASRLAAGLASPVEDCPNSPLLSPPAA